VTAEPGLGPVVAVMAVDDHRVVFVAGTDGDTRLYLLDDSSLRQIPGDDQSASPVAGTDERRVPVFEEPFPRPAVTPLAPSPDGRVLTTGSGPDGDPQIALVDVDTGDVEVLDEVEPTIDDPVSAAIVGNTSSSSPVTNCGASSTSWMPARPDGPGHGGPRRRSPPDPPRPRTRRQNGEGPHRAVRASLP
jgi:WD40 repeat protein